MKLEGYSGPMCNKHVHSTMTRSSRFHCPMGVINKPTTVELCIGGSRILEGVNSGTRPSEASEH